MGTRMRMFTSARALPKPAEHTAPAVQTPKAFQFQPVITTITPGDATVYVVGPPPQHHYTGVAVLDLAEASPKTAANTLVAGGAVGATAAGWEALGAFVENLWWLVVAGA